MKIIILNCKRCLHEWPTKQKPEDVRVCPKCHSAYWDREKKCNTCKEIKNTNEFYKRRKSFNFECKVCARKSSMEWRLKNHDKNLENVKNWAIKNKQRCSENNKKYKQKNKEKNAELSKAWRENNYQKYIDAQRKWRAENITKRAEYIKLWKTNNPDKHKKLVKEYNDRKRSTLNGRLNNRISTGIINTVLFSFYFMLSFPCLL